MKSTVKWFTKKCTAQKKNKTRRRKYLKNLMEVVLYTRRERLCIRFSSSYLIREKTWNYIKVFCINNTSGIVRYYLNWNTEKTIWIPVDVYYIVVPTLFNMIKLKVIKSVGNWLLRYKRIYSKKRVITNYNFMYYSII